MIPSWFTSGVVGFVVSGMIRVVFLRPSDKTPLETLLDREVLLTAIGIGTGIAIASAIF